MKYTAIGFRAHSGWTALVALAVTNSVPAVLARQRVHLVETFTYRFRQPYHTAKNLTIVEASAFISRIQSEARSLAFIAIHTLQGALEKQGYKLIRSGLLLASGRPLPLLPQILASHALIHTADGELFREALLHASSRCGLEAYPAKEREVLDATASLLRVKPNDLSRRIAELGRPLGPPWTQDEKLSSVVAWLALASKPQAQTPAPRS